MAKKLYVFNQDSGHLWQWNGAAWAELIATPPADWAPGASAAVCFTWRGVVHARYFSASKTWNIVRLEGVTWVAAASKTATDFGVPAATKTCASNMVHYGGSVVWVEWPDSGGCFSFAFNDTLSCRKLVLPGPWSPWSEITDRPDAQLGGQLSEYPGGGLMWSPAGSFGGVPGYGLERVFKFTPRTDGATGVQVLITDTGPAAAGLKAPRSGIEELGLANASLARGILAAGALKGAVAVVGANLVVDKIVGGRKSFLADLRDLAPFAIAGLHPYASGVLSVDPAAVPVGIGGKLTVTAGAAAGLTGDIYDLVDPLAASVKAYVSDRKTQSPLVNADLTPGTTQAQLRQGVLGDENGSWPPARASGAAFVRTLQHAGFLYICIASAVGSLPIVVARWDGVSSSINGHVVLGSAVSVAAFDALVDEDSGLLHCLWVRHDSGLMEHASILTSTFTTPSAVGSLDTVDASEPAQLPSGSLLGFTDFEPTTDLRKVTYNPVTGQTYLDFVVYSTHPGGLDDVRLQVQYDTGGGWQTATPAAGSCAATGLRSGVVYRFIHDVQSDLAGFIGSLQYRITTFTA